VRTLWIEQASDIAKEYYLSLTFDRSAKRALYMFTTRGGVDIEEVAAETPEALVRLHVDPLEGFRPWQARRLVYAAGVTGPVRAEAGRGHRRAPLRGVRPVRRDALRDSTR
jgi:succinyl-CoA synthetase beta subunit